MKSLNLQTCDIYVPREVRCSSNEMPLEELKTKLLTNKFTHKEYDPNLEGVFSKYLFEGILDVPKDCSFYDSVNDYIIANETYLKAI